MIPKSMISSPLGCCVTADRHHLNPVFKQQYVTEAGRIKMKVPVSPMHYISSANFYAHDDRLPVRPDHGYAYYNERAPRARGLQPEFQADPSKRLITPTVSFIAQPRRNLSAHAVDAGQAGAASMGHFLQRIDEKLARIELLCRSNGQELREIIHLVQPKPEAMNSNMNKKSNTRLVPKDNFNGSTNKSEHLESSEFESYKKHDNGMGDRLERISLKTGKNNDISDQASSKPARLLSQNSLSNFSPELLSKVDSKMFEVSEDLKNSNDVLENYIRNMKFEELAAVENKLDVLSGDFASVSISNGEDVERCEDASILANIESKFKKLFTGFGSKASNEDSKADEPKHGQTGQFSSEQEESLAVFEAPTNNNKDDLSCSASSSDLNSAATSANNGKTGFKSEDLKLPSKKFKLSSPEPFVGPNIKLTDLDMISILKGIDLPSKIREANLTVEELAFLQGLNRFPEDPAAGSPGLASEQNELSDADFKCDLLAPTRVDFGPVLRDDSIHALSSISFD